VGSTDVPGYVWGRALRCFPRGGNTIIPGTNTLPEKKPEKRNYVKRKITVQRSTSRCEPQTRSSQLHLVPRKCLEQERGSQQHPEAKGRRKRQRGEEPKLLSGKRGGSKEFRNGKRAGDLLYEI